MSDSWFQEDVTDESLKKAESESSSEQKRLWMPKNTSKKVVILDDKPFCIWEHNPKINGQFKGNWFTCRHGMEGGCPLCASKSKRYHIGFVTVIDVEGFKGKDGKQVKNFRQLLPMKLESLKLFKSKRHKKTTLVNAMFDLTRTDSDKAPGCGNDWDFIDYVDIDDKRFWFDSKNDGLVKPVPFNYKKLFAPMSVADMRNIGSGGSSGGGDDFGGEEGGGDEDSVY